MTAGMIHSRGAGYDHPADPYDILLRAGVCRRCGIPCHWPPDRIGCSAPGCPDDTAPGNVRWCATHRPQGD